MFDIIFNSIFDHLFDENLQVNQKFMVIAPTTQEVRDIANQVAGKMKEWGMEFKFRHAYPIRITVQDITIDFVGANSKGQRGIIPDYMFLFNSEEYSKEANLDIDVMRGFAVVIG